jgi:hypothetical protein
MRAVEPPADSVPLTFSFLREFLVSRIAILERWTRRPWLTHRDAALPWHRSGTRPAFPFRHLAGLDGILHPHDFLVQHTL